MRTEVDGGLLSETSERSAELEPDALKRLMTLVMFAGETS